ncbi:hypothetical protein FWG95_01970 [Candidatus Saccharibacteria bacterium]|nr:hypothetical protein [Candidatus Saccharibacteria bacterium]
MEGVAVAEKSASVVESAPNVKTAAERQAAIGSTCLQNCGDCSAVTDCWVRQQLLSRQSQQPSIDPETEANKIPKLPESNPITRAEYIDEDDPDLQDSSNLGAPFFESFKAKVQSGNKFLPDPRGDLAEQEPRAATAEANSNPVLGQLETSSGIDETPKEEARDNRNPASFETKSDSIDLLKPKIEPVPTESPRTPAPLPTKIEIPKAIHTPEPGIETADTAPTPTSKTVQEVKADQKPAKILDGLITPTEIPQTEPRAILTSSALQDRPAVQPITKKSLRKEPAVDEWNMALPLVEQKPSQDEGIYDLPLIPMIDRTADATIVDQTTDYLDTEETTNFDLSEKFVARPEAPDEVPQTFLYVENETSETPKPELVIEVHSTHQAETPDDPETLMSVIESEPMPIFPVETEVESKLTTEYKPETLPINDLEPELPPIECINKSEIPSEAEAVNTDEEAASELVTNDNLSDWSELEIVMICNNNHSAPTSVTTELLDETDLPDEEQISNKPRKSSARRGTSSSVKSKIRDVILKFLAQKALNYTALTRMIT